MAPKQRSNGRASLATIINGRFDLLDKRIDGQCRYNEDTRSMVVALASEFRHDRAQREERQKESDDRWGKVQEGIDALQKRNSRVDQFMGDFKKVVLYGASIVGGLGVIFGALMAFLRFVIPHLK